MLALGHPQQAVWSFTSGVVSAVRSGVIQHDAPINPGNSGGPLVDLQGRLLGINTSKLLGGAEGVGFARPIDLARTLLDPAHRPLEPDLSSPRAGATTCERILELAPDQVRGCVAWEDGRAVALAALERAAALLELDPTEQATVRASLQEVPDDVVADAWADAMVAGWAGREVPADPIRIGLISPWPDDAARARHLETHGVAQRLEDEAARLAAMQRERGAHLQSELGMQEDIGLDGALYARTRKRGLRVEEVHPVSERVTWLVSAGRNADGSTWRTSSCWIRVGPSTWKSALACGAAHGVERPEGLPRQVFTEEEIIRAAALRIARHLAGLPGSP